jgi:hypothetical protein
MEIMVQNLKNCGMNYTQKSNVGGGKFLFNLNCGTKLNNAKHNPTTIQEARKLAAKSAEKKISKTTVNVKGWQKTWRKWYLLKKFDFVSVGCSKKNEK